jgi:hypothetical protein
MEEIVHGFYEANQSSLLSDFNRNTYAYHFISSPRSISLRFPIFSISPVNIKFIGLWSSEVGVKQNSRPLIQAL